MVKKVVDGQETEIPKKWPYYEKYGSTLMGAPPPGSCTGASMASGSR